ncbi:MAG: VOC family protein [Verrucomicrobiota bacterium]|nr:VOC family protein [Verrucomicrobiota bacterium]
MSVPITPFHLAIPVDDLTSAREFYGELLGCPEGRSAEQWVDFNLYGHQVVCHVQRKAGSRENRDDGSNPVDGHDVPIPHFGVVLELDTWKTLANRLKEFGLDFEIEPYVRFEGEPGEQATMFFRDPSGNALEFKAFRDIEAELFAR